MDIVGSQILVNRRKEGRLGKESHPGYPVIGLVKL
jgi:hypothetical protein